MCGAGASWYFGVLIMGAAAVWQSHRNSEAAKCAEEKPADEKPGTKKKGSKK